MRAIDLVGTRNERLVVLAVCGRNRHGMAMVRVRCDCGTEKVICSTGIVQKGTKSCGCLRNQILKEKCSQKTHGKTGTSTHHIWLNIIYRCTNERCPQYKHYGGRGISICPQWRSSFETFLADMGERPSSKHSIDRINNDGNYEPSNCRWATAAQQTSNRRNNRFAEINGERKTMSEWCRIYNIDKATVGNRITRGWPVELAITKPPKKMRRALEPAA